MKYTTIEISPELHYKIKVQALKRKLKLKVWVSDALLWKLRSEGIFLNDDLPNKFGHSRLMNMKTELRKLAEELMAIHLVLTELLSEMPNENTEN